MIDMQNKNVKLVNSTYNALDAKDVLVSIINDKITSLHRLAFSITEREGRDVAHLKKRTEELQEARREMVKALAMAHSKDMMVKIDATISVEFVKQEEPVIA